MALYDIFVAMLDIVNTDFGVAILSVLFVTFGFMLFHRMLNR